MSDTTPNPVEYSAVQADIVAILEAARHASARSINALMTASYWQIGRRIVSFEQGGKERAIYGHALMERLAHNLSKRFGRGFSQRSIEQMRAFYLTWPIPQTLSAELATAQTTHSVSDIQLNLNTIAHAFPLPWSAYVRLLAVKNPLARSFYEAEALRGGWSVRQLDRQIQSQFYERIALSNNKASMFQQSEMVELTDRITPEQAIHDPFILEFLNLKDEYSESDLEDALIQNLFDFLLELGDDYAFVGRQRRLRLDDTWFRVDLLFYHRSLRSLFLIDLKIGKFSYADAGQMHMYINYANEHWVKPGENPPVGLILCSSKGENEAHYSLEGLRNKVLAAEYRTVLPDEQQLLEALMRTREELETRHGPSS